MNGKQLDHLAYEIYRQLYGDVDDKRFAALKIQEICDWLTDGDGGEGRSVDDLVTEWKEYDQAE